MPLSLKSQIFQSELSYSRSKNAILISCWFPCALHAVKIEIFWCPDSQMAAPIAFFQELTSAGNLRTRLHNSITASLIKITSL